MRCLAAATLLLLAGPALALSPEEAGRLVAERYGVEILRVGEIEIDGRAAYAVTFMTPPGASNAAFMVRTIAVDAESGAPVPSFRHGASGYSLPPSPGPQDFPSGQMMRERSLTPPPGRPMGG